jgi:hypothetical protein
LIFSVFMLIAWLTICIFFFIPKGLKRIGNILLFFFFTIIILNIFTILDLNLKLIEHSYRADLFISMWLQRNVIMPMCFMIFINLFTYYKSRFKKVAAFIITFLVLFLVELLIVRTGVKVYRGWNSYLTLARIAGTFALFILLEKFIRKIPERAFE